MQVGVIGQLRSIADRVIDLGEEWYDRAFTLVLLAFFTALLVMTLDYGSQTRLVPLVIGVPTLGLILVLLALQLSSRLAAYSRRVSSSALFDMGDQMEEFGAESERGTLAATPKEETDTDPHDARIELLAVMTWVLVLFAAIVLVGFVVGTFAFLIAFYRVRAGQSWLRTGVYSVVVWVFTVVVFKVVLNTPLYSGIFGIEVPLPI